MQTIVTGLALAALLFSIPSYAQTAYQGISYEIHKPPTGNADTGDTKRIAHSIYVNDVNIRAVRDFMENFKTANDVTWTILPDGFLAHCCYTGAQTRIYYDKKGNRELVCRSYAEDMLSHEIRHLVRSTYYDYSIFCINEVTAKDRSVYFIKIVNDVEWITLRIEDDEIRITERYGKG